MIIFGSGHKTLQVDLDSGSPCRACGYLGARKVSVDYDYQHIYWLFKNVKNVNVRAGCASCGDSVTLDQRAQRIMHAVLGRHTIPFMDRNGARVFLGIIVAWLAALLLLNL